MPPELTVDESRHVGQALAASHDLFAIAVNGHPVFVERNSSHRSESHKSYMTYVSERGARIGLMRCTVSGLPTATIIRSERAVADEPAE